MKKLPKSLKRALYFNVPTVFGLVILIVAIITGAFFIDSNLINSLKLNNIGQTTTAKITAVYETNTEVNGEAQIEFVYNYRVGDAGIYTFSSYSTGFYNYKEGTVTLIKYLPDEPQISRIEGMQIYTAGAIVVLVMVSIASFVALIIMLYGYSIARSNIRILGNSAPAWGKLVSYKIKYESEDGDDTYSVIFNFKTVEGITQRAKISTTKIAKVTDNNRERLIYDIKRPTRVLLFDIAPAVIQKHLLEEYPEFRQKNS